MRLQTGVDIRVYLKYGAVYPLKLRAVFSGVLDTLY